MEEDITSSVSIAVNDEQPFLTLIYTGNNN